MLILWLFELFFLLQLYDLPVELQAVVGLAPPPPVARHNHSTLKAKLHAKSNISSHPVLPPHPGIQGKII